MKKLLAVLFAVACTVLSGCGLQQVSNYGFVERPSPDGKKVAVWYYRDAGATTKEATAFVVFSVGQTRENAAATPALVIDGKIEPLPTSDWSGNAEIIVKLEQVKAPIFVKSRVVEGVDIRYLTPP